MTDEWNNIGFIVSSRYRKIVIRELHENPSTPSQIAERADVSIANISNALSQLRENNCVELLVDEERRKGRVYGLTETGQAIWDDLEEKQLL
ncbi:winged helix-turn-helix transcriptional regulator [Natronomonas salina]|nr:winged helix-turn-helix transcriptional regulator [Natronomonas salina]